MAPVIQPPPPPGWYADPAGTPGTRWWDGQSWTEHVQQAAPPPPAQQQAPQPVAGGPSLYDQPVLVVWQKTKLNELTSSYAVREGEGWLFGDSVREGHSPGRSGGRARAALDASVPLGP